MNVTAPSGITSSPYLPPAAAARLAATATDMPAGVSSVSALTPVSGVMLPRVQLPPDQLAMLQSGSGFKAPDPAKTVAQMNTRASALVRDAQTGQILGGVWPNVAAVSAPNIASDPRLSDGSNNAALAQALAQDIQQSTGKAVTIQYFQPGDPNAPAFGNNPIGSY